MPNFQIRLRFLTLLLRDYLFGMTKKIMPGLNGVRLLAFTELKIFLLKTNLPTHLNMKGELMQFGMTKTETGLLDILLYVEKKTGIVNFMLPAKFTLEEMMFVLQIQIMSGSFLQMVIGRQQNVASKL